MNERQSGIYIVTNKVDNKVFINSSTSIHNFENVLLDKLNANDYKNKRLQNAWNEYHQENFNIDILEIVEESGLLNSRKIYWINEFKSNHIEYGYNLELTKRPWQQKRDEWKQNKSWGVDGDVREVLSSVIQELDYDIELARDRKNYLWKMLLKDNKLNWLIDYISSPLFCEKQLKNKIDFLSENDISLIGMSQIVDYLVFPKFISAKDKKKAEEREYKVKLRKSFVNMDYKSNNEILYDEKEKIEKSILSESNFSNPNLKESSEQKIHKVETDYKITEDDLIKYPEIKEVHDKIVYLKKVLGYGQKEEKKEETQEKIRKKYGDKQLSYMKRLYGNLVKEVLIMKELLSRVINNEKVTKGTTYFTLDEDTGYFKENGDYVLVSENKIDFSKFNHVLELLNFYSQLRERFYEKPDSDMWTVLFVLDELIEQTYFEDYIKDILVMKIDGYGVNEIIEGISTKYNKGLTENRLSEIYNSIIPKMIVNTYLQSREDWIYTFRVKGVYKTCSKCKEVKLASKKHFSPNKQNKDGFHSYCRECR